MNFYILSYNLNALDRGIYRLSGNDRVSACRRVSDANVSRKCNNALRLPLFFRQRFHEHVGGYEIFYAMRQIVELSREPRYTIFIATELTTTITCHSSYE